MDRESIERQVLFAGLVYNEAGEAAEVVYVGGIPHYAIDDAGFKRHVEAHRVDSAVLAQMQLQVVTMQDDVVRAMLRLLGKEDILTKAALEATVRNLETHVRRSDPSQWTPWLRLMGLRIVVDIHGDVVEVIYPEGAPMPPLFGDDE